MTEKRENWLLFTLAGIQFTHILDFMVMMPLGPQFTRIFDISDAQFGLLVSAYTLAGGLSGLGTLLTARWIGRPADRFGKLRFFRWLCAAALLPMFAIALLPWGTPLWLVLVTSTVFMAFMGGRMIPSMAIVTSTANPAARGTFMTLNASVQLAAMGFAALLGGSLIGRTANGQVQGYWMNASMAAVASLAAIWLADRLFLHQSAPVPMK